MSMSPMSPPRPPVSKDRTRLGGDLISLPISTIASLCGRPGDGIVSIGSGDMTVWEPTDSVSEFLSCSPGAKGIEDVNDGLPAIEPHMS